MSGRERVPELVRGLGESLIGVVRAEIRALGEEYRRSARRLAGALGLVGLAAAFAFWAVGALGLLTFELLSRALPRWGAAAVLLGLLLSLALVLGWWGWRRLTAIEPPLATAGRHLDEHLRWWQEGVLGREPSAPEAERLGARPPEALP